MAILAFSLYQPGALAVYPLLFPVNIRGSATGFVLMSGFSQERLFLSGRSWFSSADMKFCLSFHLFFNAS
jgi:hypothetical protein